MKRMSKVFLSALLCVALLVPGLSALAASSMRFTYSEDGKTLTISGYGDLNLRNETSQKLEAVEVLYIEEGFSGVAKLNHLGSHFKSVREVYLPGSIEDYPDYTFIDCPDLERVVLGEGTRSIGDYSFSDCPKLASVTLPDTLKTIGNHTFCNCGTLREIVLPEGLETIDSFSFRNCDALESITLPPALKDLGFLCFEDCDNLETMTVHSPFIANNYPHEPFRFPLKMLILGQGIETVNAKLLYISTLEEIRLPDTLRTITGAYSGLPSSIPVLHIPSSVERIDENALIGFSALCAESTDTEVYRYARAHGVPFAICGEEFAIPERMPIITLSPVTAHPGDTVEVPLVLQSINGMTALEVTLDYDNSVMTLLSVQDGHLFGTGNMTTGGTPETPPTNIIWTDALSTENHKEIGTLATLTFKLSEDAPINTDTTVAVSAKGYTADLQVVSVETKSGTVHIQERPRLRVGDVNCDFEINVMDAVLLKRYLVGGWGVTFENPDFADIDRNGTIDVRDAAMLLRYLAGGWDIQL